MANRKFADKILFDKEKPETPLDYSEPVMALFGSEAIPVPNLTVAEWRFRINTFGSSPEEWGKKNLKWRNDDLVSPLKVEILPQKGRFPLAVVKNDIGIIVSWNGTKDDKDAVKAAGNLITIGKSAD